MREGTFPVSQVNVAAGCHDEHPRCPEWARLGMCVIHGTFMTHTCRESCGVCGFLSPSSKVTNTHQICIRWGFLLTYFSVQEEQISSGKSYSDFSQSNFDCGRYKLLADINGNVNTDPVSNQDSIDENVQEFIEEEDEEDAVLELREDNPVDDDFVFYFTNENKGDYFCGATQINDRYC